MRSTVSVDVAPSYSILTYPGLLAEAGTEISLLGVQKAAIITDDRVASLYLPALCASLDEACIPHCEFVFPNGEAQKSFSTLQEVYHFLTDHSITRSDLILALGGGVVGDLAGFAAATYLRGVRFVQIPTTFLAQIDSSVGGKTAVNLDRGKNLIGSFYQPSLVLCDPKVLSTLPEDTFADGTAEAIKYAVLADPSLFSLLESEEWRQNLQSVITTCISIKKDYVQQDEHDTGIRMQLNLGHTVGHAMEQASRFSVSHGHAVAIGLAVIAKACARHGVCTENTCARILRLLQKNRLLPALSLEPSEILSYFSLDKKRDGDLLNAVLIRDIGSAFLQKMTLPEFSAFIEKDLTETLVRTEELCI